MVDLRILLIFVAENQRVMFKRAEVDFIIEYNKQCIAIEVKSGKRTSNEGLSVFRDKFHPAQSFVVGSGGIPIDEFLSWDIGRLLNNL